MDMHQLLTVVCVAKAGSLSKAADQLCTAQPALSRHVRLLEAELGTRIFDRNGRGMVLTEEGQAVHQHALRVLTELDSMRAAVADKSKTLRGVVSIGMPPSVAEVLTVPLIASIRKAHPSLTCRIVSAYSAYLLDWIHQNKIDIAIMYDPVAVRSLKSEPLLEEQLVLVAPLKAGLAVDAPIRFRDLKQTPMVLPSRVHSLRQIVDKLADDCGFSLDVKIEADCSTTLKHLVRNDLGWTILPLAAVRNDVSSSLFCVAPLIDPPVKRVLELSLPVDRPVSRLAAMARRAILKVSSTLVKQGSWPGELRLGK